MSRPGLASLALATAGLPAIAAASLAIALAGLGRPQMALGVVAGWAAGSINAGLLTYRVSRLSAKSTVFGFLYGMSSRFALVALLAVASFRLIGASLWGFAIGLALVLVLSIPLATIWSMRQQVSS